MKQIIAMHGWGGDSNSWDKWINKFKGCGWTWQNGERGYGAKNPYMPIWENTASQKEEDIRAFIGHSLGPHLIKKEILLQATHIIFLCSFGAFIPKNTKDRKLKIALKGMKDHLGTKEEANMLKSFLIKACQPASTDFLTKGPIIEGISSSGRERLKNDLELLRNSNGLPNGIPNTAKVLVIEANQDHIVNKEAKDHLFQELSEKLINKPIRWQIPYASHAIIPPEIINRTKNWLESC